MWSFIEIPIFKSAVQNKLLHSVLMYIHMSLCMQHNVEHMH